ncbi:mitochondrial amidoxime-reducing component 1 [Aplysia californica]|uniref:Mitochondrial amidoxime-reducing component 1 n=1 Tax=Aplysia californica TaxID=6500 RepID=A0ABM1VXW3_APLCA|nr:mitochondrial amidoxime-reducing component 1 [Aplysia californica]XP_035827257.1 mitochondrial amidoxime-reducing component 1 [Aplysia californica]XP_035827258.1 mitochondrial amidoxime-reducing component 1 [Aplysia californica]XP_035827259.1 mitochondrial amidoxime-reducing component 1 [Aplysia californica]XP_035827260.1 mitochondrial amidoxime-reducing component 1 [Aplysia californica]XP_035827261.1 mitochondrial amidoxime-reducing component 1 [Aplysia californica]
MLSYIFELEDTGADILAAVVLGTLVKAVGLLFVSRARKQRFVQVGTVSELYIYPVKSCGALTVTKAMCTSVGLSSDGLTDRHWMILDKNKQVITMKEAPSLTTVTCSAQGDILRLHAPQTRDLDLPMRPKVKGTKVQIKNFEGQNIPMIDCGEEAEKWISDFVGRPANIFFSCPELGLRDSYERKRKWDNTAREGDVTVFSYLTSYLISSTASLGHINSQLDAPVASVNFRPSIVVDNSVPFDEDNWKELKIGENVLFHAVEPCRRCIITTIDPKTGQKRKDMQPLKLLRSFRCREPYGNSPIYGNYMSNDMSGDVSVGDPVFVIRDD